MLIAGNLQPPTSMASIVRMLCGVSNCAPHPLFGKVVRGGRRRQQPKRGDRRRHEAHPVDRHRRQLFLAAGIRRPAWREAASTRAGRSGGSPPAPRSPAAPAPQYGCGRRSCCPAPDTAFRRATPATAAPRDRAPRTRRSSARPAADCNRSSMAFPTPGRRYSRRTGRRANADARRCAQDARARPDCSRSP